MKVGKILKIILIAVSLISFCFITIISYGYYIVKIKKANVKETAYIYITPNDNSTTIIEKLSVIEGIGSTKGFELLAQQIR